LLSETQDRSRQGALQTPLENEIAVIWEAELAVSGLGRHDYFYAIGGTSLAAITIALRLQGAGYAVTAPMVLASPTIESLALRLESLSSSHSVEDWSSEGPATLSQQDFWIAAQIDTAAANARRRTHRFGNSFGHRSLSAIRRCEPPLLLRARMCFGGPRQNLNPP
jgi:hypothetical protein